MADIIVPLIEFEFKNIYYGYTLASCTGTNKGDTTPEIKSENINISQKRPRQRNIPVNNKSDVRKHLVTNKSPKPQNTLTKKKTCIKNGE